MRTEENKYAPEDFKNLKKLRIEELPEIFTVSKIVMCKFKAKNDKKEYIMTKDGKHVYSRRLYVSVNDDCYFTSKSRLMINQVMDDQISDNEGNNIIEIEKPFKATIEYEKVDYKDKTGHVEKYDNPFLVQVD